MTKKTKLKRKYTKRAKTVTPDAPIVTDLIDPNSIRRIKEETIMLLLEKRRILDQMVEEINMLIAAIKA